MQIKIAHIADIHIKNKYIEYYELLNTLHNERPNIIVLVGDIIDSISNINPAIILDVVTFLSSLINIAPIIMIPGNHDISCKLDDGDFFTAITDGHTILKPPRFNYWRHSGKYEFNDIIWTVVAPDEDVPEYIFDIKQQILLFHENLDRFNLDTFKLFTAVMAGHIHTRQLIGNNGAYCGSLFQQNINESHNGHGLIMWNISNEHVTITEINIKNNFGFLKVELEGDTDVTELPIPDKVLYYDIYHNNTSYKFLIEVIDAYTNIYGFKPRNIKDKNKYTIAMESPNNCDIDDIALHNTLIRNYLVNKGESNERINDIIELHKKYYTTYYNYQESNNGKIRLLSLEFENMYNFEGSNYIDFTKLENKLSGIIGMNNIGKTAFIDVILYALYDVHPRISSKKCIINKNCTSYSLTLEFELNGKLGTIKKGSVYTFYYDDKDYTQKTIPLTLNEIKKIIGNYNDAILSSFQLQYNYNNFTNMSSNSRKQKLAEILSLRVFENIETEVVKELSEISGKIKMINALKNNHDTTINEDKIQDIKNQIKYANMLGIVSNKTDTDDIDCSDTKFYEQMVHINQVICSLENERDLLYAIVDENKSLVIEYPNATEDTNYYNNEIEKIELIVKNIDYKIEIFEPKNIKDAVINKYNEFGISYLYKLCKIDKHAKVSDNTLAIPASMISCLLLEKDHNMRLIDTFRAKLILCERATEQLNHSMKIEKINKTIVEMKKVYDNLTKMVNSTNKLYYNLYEEYKKYIQKDIEEYRLTESNILNKNYETLKLYRQVIKPTNGIINIMLNNICPRIEERVNELLLPVDIRIKIEQDLEILYDVNGHWLDISLSSGYQKFILNLVFRIVLWQFADVVLPDAVIIDEGFGMCDSENISIITNIIKKLVTNNNMPKLVFIISHVDYLINNIEAPLFIEDGKFIVKQYVHFSEDMLDKLIETECVVPKSSSSDISTEELSDKLDTMLENNDNISQVTLKLPELISESITREPESPISLKSLDSIDSINSDKYYCEKCNIYIKLTSKNKHLLSQKHKN